MVDRINIYLLYWYFHQTQYLNIQTYAVHNIQKNVHRLPLGPYARVLLPGKLPIVPMLLDTTDGWSPLVYLTLPSNFQHADTAF